MKQKCAKLGRQISQNKTVYFMLLPGLFFLTIFAVYPITWILKNMFYQFTSYGDYNFIGLENFARLVTDPQFFNALKNTIVYAFFKLLITIPLAFLLAYFLNLKLRGRMIYRTVFFMPTIISVSVMSMVFYLIFNPYNGSVNGMLQALGIIKQPINWFNSKNAMITVLIVAIWGAIGNYMIYFLSGLQTIPQEVYESAEIDGATGWKKLRYVTIPMMAPITQMVIMLALIQAFKDYENILVLTAGGPNNKTEVLYLYIYRLMFPMGDSMGNVVLQYGYGATVAFATAVLVGVITMLYLRWTRKTDDTF
ncbi:MAG: sugar ABC transporter permease [Oscillospiraceae bacterium]|nr:sugar ABC transporter permease [Oscillospiraceae bacterium]